MRHRSIAPFALALLALLALTRTAGAADEQRYCLIVRSDEPIAGDVLAAVIAGEATIELADADACAAVEPPSAADDALGLLASLTVEPERPAGYDRGLFRHWVDADRDGCDTRREVLIEESLTDVRVRGGCTLRQGSWFSVFDGLRTTDAADLDIDHVVPLAEAWRSGARDWSDEQREAFANDLGDGRTLRAVSAGSNRSKGDQDPAGWLPPDESFQCTYVEDWVAIKAAWDLSVDMEEQAAIDEVLHGCS
jgi:hypothetical protein